MSSHSHNETGSLGAHCCMGHSHAGAVASGISRRGFLGGVGGAAALAGMAMAGSQARAASAKPIFETNWRSGAPLRVQPVLVYKLCQRKELTSWRSYGGLQTPGDVDAEAKRIKGELEGLSSKSEFGMEVLPLMRVADETQAAAVANSDCDVILVYAASGKLDWFETIADSGKPNVMFLRHRSGPFYLLYETAHWFLLRRKKETMDDPVLGVEDIVVDDYEKVFWRLRALYGLKNTRGTKCIAIGGPRAYTGIGQENGPKHVKNIWDFEIISVPYQEVEDRLKKTRADGQVMRQIQRETNAYLAQDGISLEVDKKFVVNTFITTKVFKEIMAEHGATNIGPGDCMHKLIPITDTPPCLVLAMLNDEGLTAFCHCDYTQTPPGILMRYIAERPAFLCNSHFPHDGIMTFAHCAAPRRMNGKDYEPTKIQHHYESDYGAATKVEYRKGQVITAVIPNFSCTKWLGFKGTIIDSPSYPACTSQINMQVEGDWRKLLTDIQGFHTLICYGDYLREVGYALKKLDGAIEWENISENV